MCSALGSPFLCDSAVGACRGAIGSQDFSHLRDADTDRSCAEIMYVHMTRTRPCWPVLTTVCRSFQLFLRLQLFFVEEIAAIQGTCE